MEYIVHLQLPPKEDDDEYANLPSETVPDSSTSTIANVDDNPYEEVDFG